MFVVPWFVSRITHTVVDEFSRNFYASSRAGWAGCRRPCHASVTKFVNTIFLKRMNQFWCKLSQVVHGARAYNGQGQGHAGPVLVTKMPFPQDFCPMNFNQTWRIVVNADRVTTVYICKRSKVKVTWCERQIVRPGGDIVFDPVGSSSFSSWKL